MATRQNKGLPGLHLIREKLGLSQARLGAMCNKKGRPADYIRHIEGGHADCSQTVQRELAAALCCTVADLHAPAPADDDQAGQLELEERLKQIEIAYKRRELEQLEAGKQKGVA